MRALNAFRNKPKLERIDAFLYLEKLGLTRARPDLAYLKKIQKQHLLNIPHENLDIHFGKKQTWDVRRFFKKMVAANRGGINLELNCLLYHLLNQLGYRCRVMPAHFPKNGRAVHHSHEHMIILVGLEKKLWIVDVGMTECPIQPVALKENQLQVDYSRYLRVSKGSDDHWHLQHSRDTSVFQTLYRFKITATELIEFLPMYHFYYNDSASRYRNQKIVSQLFKEGRVTLTDRELSCRLNGKHRQLPILNEDEFLTKLDEYFGIQLQDLLKQ